MTYYAQKLEEERNKRLENIEDQLHIQNLVTVIKESYVLGLIDKETYAKNLEEAYRILKV